MVDRVTWFKVRATAQKTTPGAPINQLDEAKEPFAEHEARESDKASGKSRQESVADHDHDHDLSAYERPEYN
jgi:hypothetical protein